MSATEFTSNNDGSTTERRNPIMNDDQRGIQTGLRITCPTCGRTGVRVKWGAQNRSKPKRGPGEGPMRLALHNDPSAKYKTRCTGVHDAMDLMLAASGLRVAFSPATPDSGRACKQGEQGELF